MVTNVMCKLVLNSVSLISVDLGNDLNAELSRVVSELESAISDRKQATTAGETQEVDTAGEQIVTDNESTEEKTMQVGDRLVVTSPLS